MKHIPGPWFFDMGNMQVERVEDRQPICEISLNFDLYDNNDFIPEFIENAYLIAAAPEMYAHLKDIYNHYKARNEYSPRLEELRKIIMKAEGSS